jgi:hypothetical protein
MITLTCATSSALLSAIGRSSPQMR